MPFIPFIRGIEFNNTPAKVETSTEIKTSTENTTEQTLQTRELTQEEKNRRELQELRSKAFKMKFNIEDLENKLQKAHVIKGGDNRSAIKQYAEQIKAYRPNFGVGNFNHPNPVPQGLIVPKNVSKYSTEILQLNRCYQRQDQINARIQELEGSIHLDETEFRTK